MSDRFLELRAFARAAETGSFSRAARELGLSQPSVSRLVMALEERLGTPLLLRTTRRVGLTPAGEIYHGRIAPLLAELDEADAAATGTDGLRGTLRVALPVTLGSREIVPRLVPFLERHPELRLDLLMDERPQDLVEEGVDLALRIGRPLDSTFGLRRIATSPRRAIASPAYLARFGRPTAPAELAGHRCILGPGGTPGQEWTFTHPSGAVASVRIEAHLRVTAAQGVTAAVAAGMGIGIASQWMCAAELAAGEVVPVLAPYLLPPAELYALLPAGRRTSLRARSFIDHLVASFRSSEETTGDSSGMPMEPTPRSP
ncbi:MAG: LysR family transcriptional regulator [Geminicoccaceae bacterium]